MTWNIGTTTAALPGTLVTNLQLFGFRGNDTTTFWGYDTNTLSWRAKASAPGTVKDGGMLSSDGVNIYATRGDNTTAFSRYNVASNTWTTLASVPGNLEKNGNRLFYLAPHIYLLRGDLHRRQPPKTPKEPRPLETRPPPAHNDSSSPAERAPSIGLPAL